MLPELRARFLKGLLLPELPRFRGPAASCWLLLLPLAGLPQLLEYSMRLLMPLLVLSRTLALVTRGPRGALSRAANYGSYRDDRVSIDERKHEPY